MSNDAFCPLPWAGLHYGCDGYIYPCCYINQKNIKEFRLGHVKDGAEKAFNNTILKDMRLKMLSGVKIEACSGCYRREELNFESFRQWKNKQYKNLDISKTQESGHVPFDGFRYFEFKISNLCNLKCRICDSGSSTSWYRDEGIISGEQNCFNDSNDLIEEFKKHQNKVDLIYFFGGEPFLIKQHYDLLNYLCSINKYDLEIHYSTNLTVYTPRVQECLNKLNRFKKVVIIGSLDGSGKKFEFLRKNSNWNVVEKNLKIFSNFTEHFYLMPSLCNMNIYSIFDTLTYLINARVVKPENIILNTVFEPQYLAYTNLGPILKNKVIDRINEFKLYLQTFITYKIINSINTENIIVKLDNILASLNKNKKFDLKQFFNETIKLDKKRNENFLTVFPEFYEDLKNEKLL